MSQGSGLENDGSSAIGTDIHTREETAKGGPPHVTDVAIDLPLEHRVFPDIFVWIGTYLFYAAIAIVIGLALGGPVAVQIIGTFALFGVAVVARTMWRYRAPVRHAREQVAKGKNDDPAKVAQAVLTIRPKSHAPICIREMVRAMAAQGRCGETLRICPPRSVDPIEPIVVSFEPQLLDETDTTLSEIQSAVQQLPEGPTRETPAPADEPGDPIVRRVKRNVLLKGGWVIAGLIAVGLIISTGYSITQGVLTRDLVLWWTAFTLALLAPVGSTIGATNHFFAVPGGLVVRRSKALRQIWNVHLFKQETSVLCVYQEGRHKWGLTVADSEQSQSTVGTRKEMQFALQAWLSPLPPPEPDKLTDLL